jgi:hypothetical protein
MSETLKRHARLLSILEQTGKYLGERNLKIIHTDPSFLIFDPNNPTPWLADVGQAEYLLSNHKQIELHGKKRFFHRILLIPNSPSVFAKDLFIYYAAVKGAIHMQLYEEVRVGIKFVNIKDKINTDFNFVLVNVGKHIKIWPSVDYYNVITTPEAFPASKAETEYFSKLLSDSFGEILWLSSYREEHFEAGLRTSISSSWRKFLFKLHRGICIGCNNKIPTNEVEIDHLRPLCPTEDPFLPIPEGNSVIFNLAPLCKTCNREKMNKSVYFPESHIDRLILHPLLKKYFKASLRTPPKYLSHKLPDRFPPPGENF